MAYNLQSLITILQQILNPQQTRWIVDHNKPQLQSLLEKSTSLHNILEKSSLSKVETSLESQIRDAAREAEDIIESHMVDQMLSEPRDVSFTFLTPDLQQVTQQLDSIMEQVVVSQQLDSRDKQVLNHLGSTSSSGASQLQDLSAKNIVVGVDEDLMQLKDRLVGMHSKLEMVPIVGMGGIGKTTLARSLYEDPLIVEHFTSLAWVTISQDYNLKATLVGILQCIIGKDKVDEHIKNKNNLSDILYRSLFGRKYMIVLDDVWSTNFWNEIRMYFPNNHNGSRIVITTRESEVAKHANSESKQHEMQLLDVSESWNLLRQRVFGVEENCPAPLERIGRNIATNCGGLPLAIHVVGGLLSKANRAQEIWENVANDVRAAVAESNEQISNILSLSYNHLPSHLRPCFLYLGAFPEDYEVKASRLIRLWVAEGFLKSKGGDKSLEDEAEDCLKDLVGRNLISIRTVKSNGRPKSYGMHDLMRDVCLKKAEEERFVHVGNKVEKSLRRVSLHPLSYRIEELDASTEFMSFARSFLFTGHRISDGVQSHVFFGLKLLRVLDVYKIEFNEFPTEILLLVNLRYLAFTDSSESRLVPSGISRLCNLQTLVIYFAKYALFVVTLPSEIWKMAELRHLIVHNAEVYIDTHLIHEKLETIYDLRNPSDDFFHKIPNIKKLRITDSLHMLDLCHLHKLETLKFPYFWTKPRIDPSTLRLPHSLRKLEFGHYELAGEFMEYLCELPNLEVLKLRLCKIEGKNPGEWDVTQQQFNKLQFLLLCNLELVHWKAEETSFPRLRRLVIRGCSALEEIPSRIGEIPTLQAIELDDKCRPSLVDSAKLIIEEQRDNGNDELQLRISQG